MVMMMTVYFGIFHKGVHSIALLPIPMHTVLGLYPPPPHRNITRWERNGRGTVLTIAFYSKQYKSENNRLNP